MENKKISIATIACICVGIILRVYHLFFVGFSSPWNYGGLFLEFSRQIFNNHYVLPKTIPYYTQGGLPFAYPPIPFYFEALLVFTVGFPQFFIVNLLPPLLSIISLLAFWFLVKETLENKYTQLFALLIFSISPLCFRDQVQADGLAESFGTLFTILLFVTFWKYYQNPLRSMNIFLPALTWAMTVMASPGSAYLSVLIFFSFFAILINNTEKDLLKKVISNTFALALIAVILSSMYWGVVIRNHGIGVFVNSFVLQNGGGFLNFAKESLRTIANLALIHDGPVILRFLLVVALCILLFYKEHSLFFLTIAAGIVPRETWVMGIVGVFIIGYAFDLVLRDISCKGRITYFSRNFSINLIIYFIVGVIISETFYFVSTRDFYAYGENLDREQIIFLENIKSIDTANADLLIVNDTSFIEWAPYISRKTVLNVSYGTEFAPAKQWLGDVGTSLGLCLTLDCVNEIISAKFKGNILVIIDLKNKPKFDRNWSSSSDYYDFVSLYKERFIYYYFKH